MDIDKRKKIEQAVEDNKGKWGSNLRLLFVALDGEYAFRGNYEALPPIYEYLCTHTEFKQVAKELGYINGYKWGVEYPTNGVKPDLPDDVFVEVRNKRYGFELLGKLKVSRVLFWSNIELFRIVDKRYKPKDHVADDSKKPEWDGEGLPPVGALVLGSHRDYRCGEFVECEILKHHEETRACAVQVKHNKVGVRNLYWFDRFRPLRTEEDELIDELDAILNSPRQRKALAKHIVKELGWRPPKQD